MAPAKARLLVVPDLRQVYCLRKGGEVNPQQQADETTTYIHEALGSDPDVMEFVARCTERINTDGANEYYDANTDKMKFETLPVSDLFRYLEEELLDAANYVYMLEMRGGPFLDGLLENIFWMWHDLELARTDEDEIITTEWEMSS